MQQIITKLDYNNGTNVVPEGEFRISASGISKFFTATNAWYRENLLGESGFTGNSASVTGTIVHYILEQYAAKQHLSDEDKEQMELYITKHCDPSSADFEAEIDESYIRDQYKVMAETGVNSYLQENMPTHVEPFIANEVLPGIHVGGSIDNLTLENPKYSSDDHSFDNLVSCGGGIICDYKTTGTRPTSLPKNIQYSHKMQLLTYAWVLKQMGITIDRVRIIYITKNDTGRVSEKTGKPLTQYPSQVVTLTEQITDEDFDMVEGVIKLIAHSVDHWNKSPEFRHLLAQDWRLRDERSSS